jgi:hypothetical protein
MISIVFLIHLLMQHFVNVLTHQIVNILVGINLVNIYISVINKFIIVDSAHIN